MCADLMDIKMTNIEFIHESDYFYGIKVKDGPYYMQRKNQNTCSDEPLDIEENIIVALCGDLIGECYGRKNERR